MTIVDTLSETHASTLDISRFVSVTPETTVADTVERMSHADRSCACVVDDENLVGIFTQRDVLLRVIGRPSSWEHAIADEMSRSVRVMRDDETVADGLAIMVDWWVRNVPVLDHEDRLVGSLSFFTVMKLMAELLATRIEDPTHAPSLEDGLTFVDFTGLNMTPPVIVDLEEPVSHAAHHMRARGIGSVLVANDRHHLAGVVTEFDLQTKVGCMHPDPAVLKVEDVMSEPVALSARSSIADVIREIAERGYSNVPLIAESGRPAGVASFRDVAAFIETSLDAWVEAEPVG